MNYPNPLTVLIVLLTGLIAACTKVLAVNPADTIYLPWRRHRYH